jgi:hypothetical protein
MVTFARTQAGRLYAETLKAELKKANITAIGLLEELLKSIKGRPDDEAVIVGEKDEVIFTALSAKEDIESRLTRYRVIVKAELNAA